MFFFNKKKNTDDAPTPSSQDINALLYKRNSELATKNKALSLLGNLYQTSISTLKQNDLARSVATSVRMAFNYELVSIYLYSEKDDTLTKIGISMSDRLGDELRLSGHSLDTIVIDHASQRNFFDLILRQHKPQLEQKFGYILKNTISEDEINRLSDRAHLKSSIIYPLAI